MSAGVPHAVGIDEPQVVDRALRILHTGDWNTHLFDYPTLVIYLHAVVAIAALPVGRRERRVASLDALESAPSTRPAASTTALIGIATVWLTYRLGAELGRGGVALLGRGAAGGAIRMHVRESHFILTDMPMTALTTLAVWLAVAGRKGAAPTGLI